MWSEGQISIFGVPNSFDMERKSEGSRPSWSSGHSLVATSRIGCIWLPQLTDSMCRLTAWRPAMETTAIEAIIVVMMIDHRFLTARVQSNPYQTNGFYPCSSKIVNCTDSIPLQNEQRNCLARQLEFCGSHTCFAGRQFRRGHLRQFSGFFQSRVLLRRRRLRRTHFPPGRVGVTVIAINSKLLRANFCG